MSVAILNGLTVAGFVEDKEAFEKCINEHFHLLDVNGDGVLSRAELRDGFAGLLIIEIESKSQEEISEFYDMVFDKFDLDCNGKIDLVEFTSEMKEIMLAVASGIGESPVQVALESESLLMKAVEHEMARNAPEAWKQCNII